jgi:tetratricopeptide (TPR) repeat protein
MKFIQKLTWLHWLLLGFFILIFTGTIGLAFGYLSGNQQREKNLAVALETDIQTQYDLGLQDFNAGNYALAQQRFDYVLQQDPNYPGVVDMLSETLLRMAEPTTIPVTATPAATATPSPTPDTRQVDEIFAAAESQFTNQDWKTLVETIAALRNIDPQYRAVDVDRMLYLGLLFNGIDKIMNQGDLEGGVYDLALVERFAPLDSQAQIYQEWARLYQIGVSFWGVLPEKSVEYFSQLASAAPYLRDLSGIYASDRYRMALLQYGDRLAQMGEWCLAVEQYNLAQSLRDDQAVQPTVTFADDQCASGGDADEPEETEEFITITPGLEITGTLTLTPTPGLIVTEDVTPSPTQEVILTPTPPEATLEPTPVPTEPVEPTPVPTEPLEPTPQDTAPVENPEPTATPETSP